VIGEFEKYHGVALRELIVCAPNPILIAPCDDRGRVNSYILNGSVGLHIKHSAKRLSPWQFTFHGEHLDEIERLEDQTEVVWLALVCGPDGVVAITADELREMNLSDRDTTWFVRVDRDRRTMYHLNGSASELGSARPRGLAAVISDSFEDSGETG
jgi:hypothetical protein